MENERRLFCSFICNGFFVWARRLSVRQGKAPVVEALTKEDDVGKGVVDGQYDHSRKDVLEHSTKDIEDIAQKPDDDEDD